MNETNKIKERMIYWEKAAREMLEEHGINYYTSRDLSGLAAICYWIEKRQNKEGFMMRSSR